MPNLNPKKQIPISIAIGIAIPNAVRQFARLSQRVLS